MEHEQWRVEFSRCFAQTKRLLVSAFLLALGSCADVPNENFSQVECDANRSCHLIGRLAVAPGGFGSGSITTSTACYDLALPKNVLQHHEKWDGRKVLVVGEATHRPQMKDLSWYDVKDRKIETGGCGQSTIHVQKIEPRE